jgi:prenyltransferase/squalene oxidase-like repeat protein
MLKSLGLSLALVSATLASTALALAQSASAPQQPELNLGEEIRTSVRWLRAQQDPKNGSYGNVESTSWALRAFAECPDKYRASDGPFVRRALDFLKTRQSQDGSIADEGVSVDARVQQTRLAAAACAVLADANVQDALQRALTFLGASGQGPGWDGEATYETADKAKEAARALLAKRAPDGSWKGEQGAILATAKAMVELTNADRAIKKGQKPPSSAPVVPLPTFTPAERAKTLEAMEMGANFLVGSADGGKWGAPGKPDAGITAMIVSALESLPEPRPANVQKAIDQGLVWLLSLQHADGSIHDGKLANYTTSASILALARSGKPEFKAAIAKARGFLQALQADEGESYSEGDLYYGGIGYGGSERPDLSNLQMALEALSASGLEHGDPTYQKALKFLQRCQNRSESNDTRIVDGKLVIVSGDDGGAGYAPADSKAGFVELGDGTKVPRSYGSMTYALLKCLVFAGLEKQDPRVQSAWEWCRTHYTLDVNPGFVATEDPSAAYQGLFYYFSTMARALEVYGEDTLVDASGAAHNWRSEISGRMVAMQSKLDGSWINKNSPRWWEGNPLLATAYALLTLDAALPR